MQHRPTGPKHGFTLIELLVVISIIALLISVLLPALRSARTTARLLTASSQVRQLQIGLHTYATDYNQRLPFANTNPDDHWNTGSDGKYWSELLMEAEYVTGEYQKVFFSPGHASELSAARKFSGFGVNQLGPMPTRFRSEGDKWGLPIRMDEVRGPAPADIMTIADSSWASLYNSGTADGAFMLGRDLFTYNGNLARSYLDGHAESSSSDNVFWTATSQRTGLLEMPADPYWGKPWWNQKYWWPPYGNGPGDGPWDR